MSFVVPLQFLFVVVVTFPVYVSAGQAIVQFESASSSAITEPASSTTRDVKLNRTGDTSIPFIVALYTTGSASKGGDYTILGSLNVTFDAGNTTKVVQVKITNDYYAERTESIVLNIHNYSQPDVAYGPIMSHTIIIKDDIQDNTFYFSSTSTVSINEENKRTLSVTIKRRDYGKISVTATVKLSLVFGSISSWASSADCIGPATQDILFRVNEISRVVQLCTIVDDKYVEKQERFKAQLSVTGPNLSVTSSVKYYYINSDDVEFSCAGVSQSEAAGMARVSVTRRGATHRFTDIIRCYTHDDTAVEPTDFTPKSSVLTFGKNVLNQKFDVEIKNDNIVEENEILNVTCFTKNTQRVNVLSSCVNLNIEIINDDTYIYFCPSPQASIKEDGGPYVVRLCRVGVLSATHTVELCRTTEANTVPSITAACDIITFSPTDVIKSHNIGISNDNIGEQEFKRFTISIKSNDSAVTFNGTTRYDVTLQDNDNTFAFQSVSLVTANEDSGAVNVTINRVGQLSVQATVRLSLVFSGNAVSADCTGTSPRNIVFDPNVVTKTVAACTIVDDNLVEPDETFQIKIEGVGPSIVRSGFFRKNVKIISDDVNITCSNVNLKEADGPAVISLSREGATNITSNIITCTTQDNSATQPSDYTQTSENITFDLSVLSKNFSVSIKDDRIVEENETLTVTCTTSDGRVNLISCSGASIDIVNDDTYIYFCPPYKTYIREASGPYIVGLCRVGVTQVSHTVELCWTNDSISEPHDFPSITAGCVIITFAPNDLRKEYNINITDDSWGEKEFKTFNIAIRNNDAAVTFNDTTSYNVTLHDDDNSFCTTKPLRFYEQTDKYVNITIRRIGEITTTNTSVRISTRPNKAITPEDYISLTDNKTLTFLVNEVEKTVSVKIINDKLTEDEQMFDLLLMGQNGSTVIPNCKTPPVIIVSNDVNIFCKQHAGVQQDFEDQTPVLITFTREGSTQYNHTIRIRTRSGTAKSGSDFLPIDKVLTFVSGQTRIEQNVTVVKDNNVEQDESFRLEVTSSDNRVNVLCPKIDFVIRNDDTFVRCANSTISVSEEKRNVSFVLKREGTKNKASPIWYSTVDGTAYDKADYKPVNKKTVTFQPGQEYMTLNVEIVNDQVNEEDQTFAVVIGSHVKTTLTSSPCTSITIKDKDLERISSKQAQELLKERQNSVVLFSVAIGLVIAMLVVMLFVMFVLYRVLHR